MEGMTCVFSIEWKENKKRGKVTALYLLENEGFHSGKDEGYILQKQHRDTAVTQFRAWRS